MTVSTRLQPILEAVTARAAQRRREQPLDMLRAELSVDPSRRTRFVDALRRPGPQIIAECKRRSPSAGSLCADDDLLARARAYARGGAAALSVLTEQDHFGGSAADLLAVAPAGLPRLRKDFLLDEGMLLESVGMGADAVLLIAACLPDVRLAELRAVAAEVGLAVLVEVHDEAELERALATEPDALGINARDLRSFEVDLGVVERLLPRVPTGSGAPVRLAESGLHEVADIQRVVAAGADAMLVGTALMKAVDPAATLRHWRAALGGAVVACDPTPPVQVALSAAPCVPRVKVCGLTREQDVDAAVAAGADAIGFVHHPPSPRHVEPDRLAALARCVPPGVRSVAVLVDPDPAQARALIAATGVGAVQLCGADERPEDWTDLDVPVLRRVGVDASGGDFRLLAEWSGVASAFVLDHPSGPGGTGRAVDHERAATLARRAPCLLAGGLDGSSVSDAVAAVHPAGVDGSSKLERAPGLKDEAAVAAFVHAARTSLGLAEAGTLVGFRLPSRFGTWGGTFAPETLMANLIELETAWREFVQDDGARAEFGRLLADVAGRPTPLTPALRLSEELGCAVWLKREDLLHTGAHKLNNCLGQALLALRMGKTRVLAETGAGQHGVATATACALLGLECVVYMGAVDAARQRPNVERMRLLGAEVKVVEQGSQTLKDAINEALRDWVARPEDSHYLLGSALGPHPFPTIVAGLQSVIGAEARCQIEARLGHVPDAVVACVGGGSNAIGIFRGFLDDPSVQLIGVEAGGEGVASGRHAARFAGGSPGVLHGCKTLLLQDEHGQISDTHSISAGLDYPAIGPEHVRLAETGRARYELAADGDALEGFQRLARSEGILAALESSHAIGWLVRHADRFAGRTVLVNISGRGDKDLATILEALSCSPAAGDTP